MATQLVTHSLSDPRLSWLVLDVLAAAQTRSPLLITGERNEALLVARLVHEVVTSDFMASHFVVVDPEVLSENLTQFSVASSSQERRGRPSRASEERWTLCVEDVDQLTLSAQELLVNFLDAVCVSEGIPNAPRLIATATTNLGTRVASNDFLPDLFYRLNVVHVLLSPARAGSLSSLDYSVTEEGAKRTGKDPALLSIQRLRELLASDRLRAAAQLQPLLASV
jgi:DNA-binding NtrC family response regulator